MVTSVVFYSLKAAGLFVVPELLPEDPQSLAKLKLL